MPSSPNHFRVAAIAVCALGLALAAVAADPTKPGAPPPNRPQAGAMVPPAPIALIVRDVQTGLLRAATAQEIQAMASEIDQLLGRGKTTSKVVRLPDGSTARSMTGNFANGTVARRNADGTIETGCFDEPEPAKAFLGLVHAKPAPAPAKAEGR
ncbi:MAG: hypothetical protein HY825_01825 [Acidobacteria bacterium]|nr:hypothetical protein [Acidobacteriota bacterium]